ncbi:MAG: bifunctional adenosylcobinamide kinase/adenosylcobinamide-phosphate guanylyltransferase, partial [Butyricicoccus sp.]
MTIFITGGCKNGKSTFALRQACRLSGAGPRYYVATMEPCDAEERERVRIHRAARAGMGFLTLEQGRNLPACLSRADCRGTFLLDSVTALLANVMFPSDGPPEEDAVSRIADELVTFLSAVRHAVIVSDFLYSDGACYAPLSERYRQGLSRLDRLLAQRCDCVVEICAGLPVVCKGSLPEEKGGGTMHLIVGGVCQGKLDYAKTRFGISEWEIFHCTDTPVLDGSMRCIEGLERYLRACLREGVPPVLHFRPDAVILCTDIFCGIVP